MEDLQFDELDRLSISELGAIVTFAKDQMQHHHQQIFNYNSSTADSVVADYHTKKRAFYNEVFDRATSFIEAKICDVVGTPSGF